MYKFKEEVGKPPFNIDRAKLTVQRFRISNHQGQTQLGFTLIELIVVLLIISLLLKFTFANFSGYVQNSYRVSAQADLLAFAGAMEQHYLSRLSYFGAAISGDIGPASIFPHHSPANEPAENRHYDLHIDYIDREGETFILRASPIDGLSGNLFYYGDGRKAWDQNNDGQIAPEEFCWQC